MINHTQIHIIESMYTYDNSQYCNTNMRGTVQVIPCCMWPWTKYERNHTSYRCCMWSCCIWPWIKYERNRTSYSLLYVALDKIVFYFLCVYIHQDLNHKATTHSSNKANINTLNIQTPYMKSRNIT